MELRWFINLLIELDVRDAETKGYIFLFLLEEGEAETLGVNFLHVSVKD